MKVLTFDRDTKDQTNKTVRKATVFLSNFVSEIIWAVFFLVITMAEITSNITKVARYTMLIIDVIPSWVKS